MKPVACSPATPRQPDPRVAGGFTLIEVLVATVLLGLAVMVLSNGVISNLNVSRDTRARAATGAYAQSVLEAYRRAWSDPTIDSVTNKTKYEAMLPPSLTGLPALPEGYTSPTPQLAEVVLKDTDGNDITRESNNVPRVLRVEVTVNKGGSVVQRLSTQIGNPRAGAK